MTQRRIMRLTGADVHKFLQDLVTNDVTGLDQGIVYTALLTPQGKFLADFFLVPCSNGILMDLPAASAETVIKRLNMYKLRADVVIADSGLNLQRGTGPAPEGSHADPRHPALGWRLYSDAAEADDGTDWDAIRVAHCIPEYGNELTPDTFILEAGFEQLNGVSFRKGCYVGQEVTARMKHKTVLRKGLRTVAVTGTAPPGTEILANGKPVGILHTQSNGAAIAYLRFDRVSDQMQAGTAVVSAL